MSLLTVELEISTSAASVDIEAESMRSRMSIESDSGMALVNSAGIRASKFGAPLAVKASVPSYRRQLTFGIAYALRTAGYLPEISPGLGVQLGSRYVYRGKPMPLVTVFAHSGFSADVVKRPVTVRIRKPLRSRAGQPIPHP